MFSKIFASHIKYLSTKTIRQLVLARGIQQNVKVEKCAEFEPVQIKVPWGNIEAKLWGSKDKQPILAVHGWMDNAGTFDMIAPLLNDSTVLAIDFPGHGLSSWLPPGVVYNECILTKAMRSVVKHFGWDKVKLLGHSMGGIQCYNYAQLFPDETQFVISIDSMSFEPSNPTKHTKTQAHGMDKLIAFEKKETSNPPSYPENVAIQRWIDAVTFSALDIPSVKTLMIRGTKQKNDGTYYFTRDFRLSIGGFNSFYTVEFLQDITQKITCPYMVIKASSNTFSTVNRYWENITDILKEKSSDFQYVELEGSHHLHMTHPKQVADAIKSFLEKHDK